MSQLDFFATLMDWARHARARAAPTPAPSVAAPSSDDPAELLERSRALLRPLGAAALADRLQVRWNPRLRSTAGLAYPGRALIALNPRLRPFGDDEIDRTLRHELAHLLAHHRAGRRRIAAHGPEWRRACRDLDLLDEKRCHDLPLPRRRLPRPHAYRCPACALLIQRARPLRRKSACLLCCRQHTAGRYDERFRLVKVPAPSGHPPS